MLAPAVLVILTFESEPLTVTDLQVPAGALLCTLVDTPRSPIRI